MLVRIFQCTIFKVILMLSFWHISRNVVKQMSHCIPMWKKRPETKDHFEVFRAIDSVGLLMFTTIQCKHVYLQNKNPKIACAVRPMLCHSVIEGLFLFMNYPNPVVFPSIKMIFSEIDVENCNPLNFIHITMRM